MSLSTLKDTTWAIVNNPDLTGGGEIAETLTALVVFKVNDKIYTSLTVKVETEGEGAEETTVYSLLFDEQVIYVAGDGDYPDEYRDITWLDGETLSNEVFIAWVQYWAVRLDIIENLHVQQMDSLDGTFKEIDFGSVKGLEFLVKNMSDAAIHVAFEDSALTPFISIPANTAQVVLTNLQYPRKAFSKIYVSGTGEGFVEVQVILW